MVESFRVSMILRVLFIILYVQLLSGIKMGLPFLNQKSKQSAGARLDFLPRLLPHSDSCYLLEFHSDQAEYKDEMEPVLRRLENDLSTKVRRINIFRRREFMGVLEKIGHDECGQLPFYYNRRTGQAVCGATSYMNLRRWAVGDLKAVFMDPPENLNRADEENFRNKRDIGAKGSLIESMKSLERRGKQKASKQVGTAKSNKKSGAEKETKNAKKREGRGKGGAANSANSEFHKKGSDAPKTAAAARTAERRAERAATRKK